jgi:hypothetical protein
MKAKAFILITGTLALLVAACQGTTDTTTPVQTNDDYSVAPPTVKGDATAITPDQLLAMLQQPRFFTKPPIVKSWELPNEAMKPEVKIVDTTDGLLGLATAKIKEKLDGYEFEGDPSFYLLNAINSDIDLALEYGTDEYHPGLRDYFFKNIVASSNRAELSKVLTSGSYYLRFMYNDRSAELIGGELFYIQPAGWDNKAVEIDIYYSEVY